MTKKKEKKYLPQTRSELFKLAHPTAQRGVLMCGMALIESVERSTLVCLDCPGVDDGVTCESLLKKKKKKKGKKKKFLELIDH